MAEVINTATYNIRLDLSNLEGDLKKADKLVTESIDISAKQVIKTTEDTTKKAGKLTTAVSTVVSNVTNRAFNTIVDGAKSFASNIISVGTGFESTMAKVAAISGAAGDDFDALSAKARQLGKDTKYSSSEVAEGFTYMAMAGWETEDMLAGIDGLLNLATASGSDLASTSDIVTDALTAFGLTASDTGRFADVLAAASSSANTNVNMMGETFKYVAPLAGAMGYSIEDTSVAIGLMAKAGIKGSQAGTSLRSMLTRLAAPTKEVQGAMDALGISITNTDGTMKPLGNVMSDLRNKFKDLSAEEQTQYATAIAGQEAMSGLLAIVNASPKDFDKLTDSVNNSSGAAQHMADVMGNTTENRIKELRAKIEELQIEAFEALQPAIDGVIQALGWCAEHMEIVIPIVTALGVAFAAIKLTNFITGLMGIGTALFGTIIPAILSTTAALLTSPITWIVLGIAAIIAGIVLLITHFEQVKEIVGAVFGWIGDFIGGVINGLCEAFQGWWDFVTGLFGGIGEWFAGIFQGVWDAVTSVFANIGAFFKGIWDTITGIFTGIGKFVGEAVSGAFKAVINGILSFIEGFVNSPIKILNNFIGAINNAFGWLGVNLGQIKTIQLPRMYTGGIVPAVAGGMPIIAGDGGEDEWVVPESKMASLVEQLEKRGNMESGNTYNIYVDGVFATSATERRKVADQIIEAINQNDRRRFA